MRGFGDRYPHQLSGGMKKRAALAQMLILSPPIVLMDEPFSALDLQTRHLMQNELLQLWQEQGMAVLFITHDLQEAITLADRVVVMSAGPAGRPLASFPIDLAVPPLSCRCHCEERSDEAIPCLTSVPRLVRQGIASSLRSSQ